MNQPAANRVDPPLAKRSVQISLAAIMAFIFLVQLWAWNAARQQDTGVGLDVDTARVQIDINQAHQRELSLLPTVGPILADRIVNDRERHGPYVSVDDLMRVHGIGEKTIAQISPYCVVTPESEPQRVAFSSPDRRLRAIVPENAIVPKNAASSREIESQ